MVMKGSTVAMYSPNWNCIKIYLHHWDKAWYPKVSENLHTNFIAAFKIIDFF